MTDIKKYSGLCIGGAMDGALLTAKTPMYASPVLAELPELADMAEVVDTTTCMPWDEYTHAKMHFVDGRGVEEIGFWLHTDYPTLKDAINRMAEVYSNATKATRRK